MAHDAAPTVSERLRSISHDLRRLSYCHRNPHLYHELKSELAGKVDQLSSELQGLLSVPRDPGRRYLDRDLVRKIVEGERKIGGRSIPVVRR